MEFRYCVSFALLGLSLAMAPGVVSAQNVVKLGMVGEFSGPFAQYGQQILGGMKAYMKVHGDTVAGKKIEIVQKDTGGPAPDVAKRLAQELVTRDNVDILVGFGLTPNALAFAPFVQRVKDAKPEAVFLFLPAGEQGIAFMKGYAERGLAQAGIKLIATGDITDDGVLEAMGEPTLGLITSFHYSAAHNSPENAAFKKAYAEVNGDKLRPNFMAAGGYDGMAAIYEALKKTNGSTDGDKLIAAMKGMKLDSPRGPISIDPETRDVVQTVYIRKVEKTGGGLDNVEFDKFPDQKDPGK